MTVVTCKETIKAVNNEVIRGRGLWQHVHRSPEIPSKTESCTRVIISRTSMARKPLEP